MAPIRGIPQWLKDLTFKFLEAIMQAKNLSWNAPIDPDVWVWSNDIPTHGGFLLPNAKIYALILQVSIEWQHLNHKWQRTDEENIWKQRWKRLWGSDLTQRAKTFLWYICKNGLFTQERAQKIGKSDDSCKSCFDTQESPEHIFFDCLHARRAWAGNAILFIEDPTISSLATTTSFIDILDDVLGKSANDIAALFIVYHTCWTLWRQRNG